jgi:periplasmic protein TonB
LGGFRQEENTMFNDLLESTILKKKTNNSWTVVLSTLVQTVILGVLVLIPLIHTEALPKTMLSILPVAPPPPAPPPPPQPAKTTVKQVPRLIRAGILVQPRVIPKDVVIYKEPELPPDVPNYRTASSIFSNIPGEGPLGSNGRAIPPSPKLATPTRIKQGGNVTAASLINQTRPVYPALAIQARIQGNVVLHAIIDKDGKVAQLEVISGHPLLVQAALDAVKQWRYKPTLLNGDPVEVDTTITVTFTMGG